MLSGTGTLATGSCALPLRQHASLDLKRTGPTIPARTARLACRAAPSEQNLTGIVFRPFDEVKDELAVVDRAGKSSPLESLARTGYTEDLEAMVNQQINVEFNNSYIYTALSAYFNRDNVGLPGFAKYFRDQSDDERDHAYRLMDHQAKRGGRVQLMSILAPTTMEFEHPDKGEALWSFELSLALEKLNFHKLRQLHAVADQSGDAETTNYIEEELLREQAEDVKVAANYVSQLRRLGQGHGVWHFDRYLYEEGSSNNGNVSAN